ncbi:MAG: PEGA domain-containing protein [Spirochaetales bacterium]|nr:PEGA domain-containing protein [Spirochaetales bacterium]
MKKKIYLLVMLILLTSNVFAQTGKIIRAKTPANYTITVNSNVKSFLFYVDGNLIKGNRVTLPLGTYSIVIKSKGFTDFITNVNLNRDMIINATLQMETKMISQNAYVSVYIPENILNYSMPNTLSQVRIFDNGVLMSGFNFQAIPGRHTIRIESGAFAIEQTYDFFAGASYRIEPVAYLNITQ